MYGKAGSVLDVWFEVEGTGLGFRGLIGFQR
jgi:hypothetical protein